MLLVANKPNVVDSYRTQFRVELQKMRDRQGSYEDGMKFQAGFLEQMLLDSVAGWNIHQIEDMFTRAFADNS